MASLAPAEKAPTGKPLKVGSPHDPAEREADRIADILTAPEEPAMPVCTACAAGGAPCAACGGGDGGGVLRRQVVVSEDLKGIPGAPAGANHENEEPPVEGEIRRSLLKPLQAKLTIGQTNDVYEQEADRVAEQVMRKAPPIPPKIQRQPEDVQSEGIQPNSLAEVISPIVQRQKESIVEDPLQAKFETCGEEEQVQRSADGTAQAQPDLERRLKTSQGGGSPLPDEVRGFMEPRFGTDFSQVRIHTDGEAVQMNRELGAQAFTHRSDIYYGAGKNPAKDELTGHELTHVLQQLGVTRVDSISRGNDFLIQRTPEEAEVLTSRHTSWGNLDETALGRELLRLALSGQTTLADEVLNTLDSNDRDDVAYEFMLAADDPQLVRLAAATVSRQFLHRVFDELTSGSVAAEEQQEADRIVKITTLQTVSIGAFESAVTSPRTKIFPFRLPGFTVLNDAPIEARRERGGIWVHSFVRVLGTDEFRAETATLPSEYFLSGIVLPETEVIGVRLYDQGGIIHYTTPLFLIQLANATNQQVLEKIIEAAGIGLTLGTGALAGAGVETGGLAVRALTRLGVEAAMAGRLLLWADRAAFVLGTVASILREHRSWLIEQFGSGFMDAVDTIHSAAAVYGLARVVLEAPRLVQGLRNGYRSFLNAARARSSSFSSAQQTTIQQVTQSTDNLVEQIDNIAGARPAARHGAAEPTTPPPSAETRPAEVTPVGPRGTRETPPEPSSSGPAAPTAAGAGGGYRPTQAELESYADRAWRMLGGRGPRPAVTETQLPPDVAGQFRSSPPTITVRTGASSPGSVIDTVWHEASHGRIRELIGFMNEHLVSSWQRTLLRPLDEIVSYFFGGLGRVIQGPTVSSRLFGILNMLGAPFKAFGSMATAAERALWIPHMLAYAAALIWAEVKIILWAIRERRESGTPQPAPAP